MAQLAKDSGWSGLRGTVQQCGSCRRPTIHLTAHGGVAVCSECGYNPAFDEIEEPRDRKIVHLPARSWRRGR